MSKTAIVITGAIFLAVIVLAYLLYGGIQRDSRYAAPEVKKIEASHLSVKVTPKVAVPKQKSDRKEVTPINPNSEESTAAVADISEKTAETDEDADDGEEIEDETPSVPKSKMIGGADVEWIPPKPKDPNDKFGEPPM